MTTAPARIGSATDFPVDLEGVKAHLRIDWEDEDLLLQGYLAAAVSHVESLTGRAISRQSWQWVLDAFPAGVLVLPFGPVETVDSVAYLDRNAVAQEVDLNSLVIDISQIEARIAAPNGWPVTAKQIGAVTLSWTVAVESCPDELHHAVLMLIAHWHRTREPMVVGSTVQTVPHAFQALIATQKRFRG